uniref:Putative disease resistance protein RGA3 n=1 Tax=Rhizophora mucronata TaxID=61149 RepID=A0A2P2LUX6_RHIMU
MLLLLLLLVADPPPPAQQLRMSVPMYSRSVNRPIIISFSEGS